MLTISHNKQLIIFIFLIIFGIAFFIYFYKQTSIADINEEVVELSGVSSKKIIGDVKINTGFFETDKFRLLRFDSLPAISFPVGKRNPFSSN